MRLKLLFIAVALFVGVGSWGQTVMTVGGGATVICPSAPTATWTTPPTGVSISNWSRGSGVTCGSASTALSGSGFNTVSAVASFSLNKYYSVTITADATHTFTLNSVVWNTAISSGGCTFDVHYSNNGGALSTFGTVNQTNTSSNTFAGSVNIAAGTSIVLYLIPSGTGATGTTVRWINGSTISITSLSTGPTSTKSGDWNDSTVWSTGSVPTNTDNVTISESHTVYTSSALTRTGTTTVNGGLELRAGGWASGTNFIYGATGTLIFNQSSGGSYDVNNGDVFWPTTSSPYNITNSGQGITMNSMTRTVSGTFQTAAGVALTSSTLTLNGTTKINAGGFFSQSPIFGSTSTLIYNTGGTYGRANEWQALGIATIGTTPGYPNNIQLSGNTTLNYNNGIPLAKAINGNLTIDSGSNFYMDYGGGASGGALTVGGNLANSGNFTLGNTSGDDLQLGGNFTNTGTFNGNNRAVFFTKVGTQIVTSLSGITMPYVVLSGGTTVQLASGTNMLISVPNEGNAISFTNSSDVFDINSNTLTIGTTGVPNSITGAGTFKGSTTSNLTLLGLGSVGTLNFTTGSQVLKNLTLDRQTSNIGFDLGTGVTIDGTLALTNGIANLSNETMIITLGGQISGASSSNYIIADFTAGGVLRKNFNANGSFTFPIGDRLVSADGTQYSPATINFTAANYSSGYAALSVEDSKESNNEAPTDFITRYWNLTSSGISSATYDFTGTYLPADISGTEANYKSGRLRTSNLTWFEGNNSGTNTVALTGLLSSTAALDSSGGYNFTAGNPFRRAEINIKQGATSYAATSIYTFAPVLTGTNNDIIFRIENTGLENLNLAAATMTGSAYSLFANYTSPVIGLTGTTTFTIRFAPTTAGTLLGSISIPNNDTTGGEAPYVINFSGIAANPAPEINVKGLINSNPSIFSGDVTPSSLNNTLFAAQTIGSSLTQTFRIENIGPANLDISAITLTGATSDFSITASPTYSITFSGTNYVDFTVTFLPTTSGVKNATVSIANNDSNENPYTFLIQGTGNCSISAINTITPTSGPAGTEVTITATANNLTGASVSFNGVAATSLTYVSSTQIKVIVPSGATSGNIVTTNATSCQASNYFSVIDNLIVSCQGTGTPRTKLFISEITDHGSGSHTYVEIFNATGATVNLLNYTVRIHNNGALSATNTITLPSFNLTNNTAYVIAFGGTDATSNPGGVMPNLTNTSSGINDNDNIRLYNSAGTWIDLWGDTDDVSFTVALKDYVYRRKNTGITAPSTIWNPSEWNSLSPVDYSNLGLYDFSIGTPPTVTTHPSYTPTCKSTTLTVSGIEGYSGTSPADTQELTYQWLVSAPNAIAWTDITNDANYSGSSTATLSIANISTVINYQYYCQVRENTNACYTASNAVKIIDGTITWNGTDWRDVNNSTTTPSLSKLAVIDANYNTTTNGDLNACSVIVNAGKILTVTSQKFVTIQNDLTINLTGKLEVLDKGSLVMINDLGTVTNNGTTNIHRATTTFEKYDYTYWSTPIALDPNPTNIETTFISLVPNSTDWRIDNAYEFNPANYMDADDDGFDDNHDDWSFASSMYPGKGYIIMVPEQRLTPPGPPVNSALVTFSGKVNNGIVTTPIALTPANTPAGIDDAVDDFNLVGNPYPSAISADEFIKANLSTTGTTYNTIEGTLYFWTHKKDLSANNLGPDAYNYSQDDYAVYTLAGGTGTSGTVAGATEDLTNKPLGYIASGQGFFVEAVNPGTLLFKNAMRVGFPATANSQFFKSRPSKSKIASKDRIWLNLENSLGMFSQQLVGYFANTTLVHDNGYDGLLSDAGNYIAFYSFIDDKTYKIQGRAAYDENDQVRLGYFSVVAGTFNINIDSKEGVFDNLSISVYLEDKLLNVIYDLKQSPYTFTTEKGTFNDRFILRYTNITLGTADLETLENQVLVSNKNEQIKVNSAVETIDKVLVYDLLGRQIYKKEKVNSNELTIPNMVSSQQTVLVKVSLQNGQTVTKKIIY